MIEFAKFTLKMTGGLADLHEIEANDGFYALSGAAFALTLVTGFVETGKIRHRGDFVGRHSVTAEPMTAGSMIANLRVSLGASHVRPFGVTAPEQVGLLYGLMRRVIAGNTGVPSEPLNDVTKRVIEKRGGDVEALVSATEPSLRRAHEVIGQSASQLHWVGGASSLGNFDVRSKAYMKDSVLENKLLNKEVSVSGFLGNSGRGLVFDPDEGRNVSITMTRDTLRACGRVFSYGLDQYLNKTGNTIKIGMTRVLSTDGRVKRYVISSAAATKMLTPSVSP